MSAENGHARPPERRGGGIGMVFKRRTTMVLSLFAALLGLVAMTVRLAGGDSPLSSGVIIGAMLLIVGAMRFWLALNMPDDRPGQESDK